MTSQIWSVEGGWVLVTKTFRAQSNRRGTILQARKSSGRVSTATAFEDALFTSQSPCVAMTVPSSSGGIRKLKLVKFGGVWPVYMFPLLEICAFALPRRWLMVTSQPPVQSGLEHPSAPAHPLGWRTEGTGNHSQFFAASCLTASCSHSLTGRCKMNSRLLTSNGVFRVSTPPPVMGIDTRPRNKLLDRRRRQAPAPPKQRNCLDGLRLTESWQERTDDLASKESTRAWGGKIQSDSGLTFKAGERSKNQIPRHDLNHRAWSYSNDP
jgi:hypothetical protein